MKTLAIFDLDGTLIDTIADLARSANYALQQLHYPPHAVAAYRLMVGNGINKMIERALPEDEQTEENVLRVREVFLPYYDQHNADDSCPYAGIPPLLSSLHAAGVAIAVASNKYQAATERIISHYFPTIPFAAVFGQREGTPVKPDPAIVYDILAAAQKERGDVLYVGDSATDMRTAAAAGVAACGVTWGFRPRAELEAQQPAYIVDSAKEIYDIITGAC